MTREQASLPKPLPPGHELVPLTYANDCLVLEGSQPSGAHYCVEICQQPFIESDHVIVSALEDDGGRPYTVLRSIDGHEIIGTDGALGQREIVSLVVHRNGVALTAPRTAYWDLYEPHLCSQGYVYAYATESVDATLLYVYMEGSDGAGSYAVRWAFSHSGFVDRVVLAGDFLDLIDSF